MTRPAKSTGIDAIQTAIYKALVAATVTVYDQVGENAAFPYTTIGESSVVDAGTKTDHADDCYETLHVWSRANGFKECKTIIKSVIAALSGYNYAESGYQIVFVDVDSINLFRDPDGLTRHGVVRVKFKVFQE